MKVGRVEQFFILFNGGRLNFNYLFNRPSLKDVRYSLLLNAYNKLFVSTARQVIHDSCKYIQNDRYWLPDRIKTRFATNYDLFYLLANVSHTNTPRKILVKL